MHSLVLAIDAAVCSYLFLSRVDGGCLSRSDITQCSLNNQKLRVFPFLTKEVDAVIADAKNNNRVPKNNIRGESSSINQ